MCLQAHIIKGTHLGLSVFAAGVPLTATFILNYSLFKMALRIRPSMPGFRPSEIFLFKKFESRNPQTFSAIATKEQTLLKEKKKSISTAQKSMTTFFGVLITQRWLKAQNSNTAGLKSLLRSDCKAFGLNLGHILKHSGSPAGIFSHECNLNTATGSHSLTAMEKILFDLVNNSPPVHYLFHNYFTECCKSLLMPTVHKSSSIMLIITV